MFTNDGPIPALQTKIRVGPHMLFLYTHYRKYFRKRCFDSKIRSFGCNFQSLITVDNMERLFCAFKNRFLYESMQT